MLPIDDHDRIHELLRAGDGGEAIHYFLALDGLLISRGAIHLQVGEALLQLLIGEYPERQLFLLPQLILDPEC
ncbi:hypothetical protein D3C77_294530 [compost metagenome]